LQVAPAEAYLRRAPPVVVLLSSIQFLLMEGAPDDDYDVDIDLDAGFKVGRHDVESIRRPEPGRLPRGGGNAIRIR